MQESEDQSYDLQLIQAFEEGQNSGEMRYFDSEEFEEITSYYLAVEDTENARDAISHGLDQHPGHSDLLLMNSRVLLHEGKLNQALNQLDELLLEQQDNDELWALKAEVYSELLEHDLAILYYQKALEVCDPDNRAYYQVEVAHEQIMKNDAEAAGRTLKMCLRSYPDYEPAYTSLFVLANANDEVQGALAYFKRLTDKNPYNKLAWYSMGLCYKQLDLHEESVHCFDLVLTIDEDFYEVYMDLANAYMAMEWWGKALEALKTARKSYNDPTQILYLRAECYFHQERYNKSLFCFRKVAHYLPDHAEAWFGIGLCLHELGHSKEGLAHLNHALSLDSESFDMRLGKANMLKEMGEFGEAENVYIRLSESHPDHWELFFDQSDLYVRMDDFSLAASSLMESLKIEPNSAEILYRLAAIQWRRGLKEDAATALNQALLIDYAGHKDMLDYLPDLEQDPFIIDIIETHKSHGN